MKTKTTTKRVRRTREQIYRRKLDRILNKLEADLEDAHDAIQELDQYEVDYDVDVSHRDITLNSGIQAAVDDCKEALIQAYAKSEGVHR